MAKIAISITLLLLCVLACHPPLSVSMQDATDSPCRWRNTQTHRCTHNPHVFIKPPHPLSLSLSQKTHVQKENVPLLPPLSQFLPLFHNAHITTLLPLSLFAVFRFLKPQKSENTQMSLMLGNLVNRPERGEAACLSAWSMATIVHCTFSEPTRAAEAISTQILGRDSMPRSEERSKGE